jgi:NADPH2:quinone reductase
MWLFAILMKKFRTDREAGSGRDLACHRASFRNTTGGLNCADARGTNTREHVVVKAVLCKGWGEPSDLAVEEAEAPSPGAGAVRVSVRAAGVNFADNLMVAGKYQFKPPFPFSPGFEASGIVAEVGLGVRDFKPGDRVMAALPHGGFAEEVVCPAMNAVSIPDGMDFPSAAAFPVAYGTVHLALIHRAHLKEGQTLLVHGAAGNVGRAAVEVGKILGATVIATGGSPESLRAALRRGADHLVHYGEEDIRDSVLEITEGRGADVVFDPVGGDVFDASLRCVAWKGKILVIGFASGRIPDAPAWRILIRNCAVVGTDWGGYVRREPETVRAATAEALRWYEEGALDPRPSHEFPLEEAADILEAQAAREIVGKAVLTVGAT